MTKDGLLPCKLYFAGQIDEYGGNKEKQEKNDQMEKKN